jgi:hypothetical protein
VDPSIAHSWNRRKSRKLGPGDLGQRPEASYGFNDRARKADEDWNPVPLQALDIFAPIFLDVGHHEIGGKPQSSLDIRIFRTPDGSLLPHLRLRLDAIIGDADDGAAQSKGE